MHQIVVEKDHHLLIILACQLECTALNKVWSVIVISGLMNMQIQTGKGIRKIRCDNGTEHFNINFFEVVAGIFKTHCPKNLLELNGVAERYNRIVMNRARYLIS